MIWNTMSIRATGYVLSCIYTLMIELLLTRTPYSIRVHYEASSCPRLSEQGCLDL